MRERLEVLTEKESIGLKVGRRVGWWIPDANHKVVIVDPLRQSG